MSYASCQCAYLAGTPSNLKPRVFKERYFLISNADKPKSVKKNQSSAQGVEIFLATLDSAFKPELLTLRQIILGVDPSITEQVKWNVPSFRTSQHFATFHLRAKDHLGIIFHLGAKVRDTAVTGINISDPESLLEWLGSDRAIVKFYGLKDIEIKKLAFVKLIRQWIQHV
jgi:hypothetical protein